MGGIEYYLPEVGTVQITKICRKNYCAYYFGKNTSEHSAISVECKSEKEAKSASEGYLLAIIQKKGINNNFTTNKSGWLEQFQTPKLNSGEEK